MASNRSQNSIAPLLFILLIAGCDQSPQAVKESAEHRAAQPEQSVFSLEDEVKKAAAQVGAAPEEITPAGSWVLVDEEQPPFFYEPRQRGAADGPITIRTKRLGRLTPGVIHPTDFVGSVLVDCPQQTLAYGELGVEYSKAGNFLSFGREDEGEARTWIPSNALSPRDRVLFDKVCGVDRV